MVETSGQTGRIEPTPVCAIGASAPGIAALFALIEALPADLGLAYLVVMRSPGEREGLLAEIAGRTRMPVASLIEARRFEPDRVYLIPPDRELVIDGRDVTARPPADPSQGARAPIDAVFRTLAESRGDGLGVVLSGPGSDGAVGVRAIKEGAGVVLVQDPAEAELTAMPRAAIATRAADFVLPVRELARRIAQVARSKAATAALDPAEAGRALGRIVELMRARTGHDLSGYDEEVMTARLLRRVQITGAADLAAYEALLRARDREAQDLFTDLLIPMTRFFRDPAAFEVLGRAAIPTIVEGRHPEDGVRAWVAGCASGEEAYSLAMLFLEEADRRGASFPLQIFATDVDDTALAAGRDGRYPGAIEADVSEERLRRFFVREGAHYRVGDRLRDAVLFAQHSLPRDPPFTRMDLDSCRNVLPLLGPELRSRALRRMHYALRPDGHLFLGAGEAADPELFMPLRREAALYVAQPQPVRLSAEVVPMPGVGRAEVASAAGGRRGGGAAALASEAWEAGAPPGIVVDEERRVLHLSEAAGRFLRPSGGSFPNELTSLARPELRDVLQLALHRALAEGEPSATMPQVVEMDGARRRVGLHVRPMSGANPPRALVTFLDGGALGPDEGEDEPSDEVRDLREQLRLSRGRLSLYQAERDAAAVARREAEEELGAVREERRLALEELDARGAEHRAGRQEMRAMLAELRTAQAGALRARSERDGLAAAAGLGAVLLDAELRPGPVLPPRGGAPGADAALLLEGLVGGPGWSGVEDEARRVLRDLVPAEREVGAAGGRRLALRLHPHRGPEDRIEGVLICAVDVTAERDAEERLARDEAVRRELLRACEVALVLGRVLRDPAGEAVDLLCVEANPAAERLLAPGLGGRRLRDVRPDLDPRWWREPGRATRLEATTRLRLPAPKAGERLEVGLIPLPGDHVALHLARAPRKLPGG